jgi:hypothetical protein
VEGLELDVLLGAADTIKTVATDCILMERSLRQMQTAGIAARSVIDFVRSLDLCIYQVPATIPEAEIYWQPLELSEATLIDPAYTNILRKKAQPHR